MNTFEEKNLVPTCTGKYENDHNRENPPHFFVQKIVPPFCLLPWANAYKYTLHFINMHLLF